jgi:hypothetical protein
VRGCGDFWRIAEFGSWLITYWGLLNHHGCAEGRGIEFWLMGTRAWICSILS